MLYVLLRSPIDITCFPAYYTLRQRPTLLILTLPLRAQVFCTTRIPLLVQPESWDERHRRILRLGSSFCRPLELSLPSPNTALLPEPRSKSYDGDEIDPAAGQLIYADGRAFWDFLTGLNYVSDVLRAGGSAGERLFCYRHYPDDGHV